MSIQSLDKKKSIILSVALFSLIHCRVQERWHTTSFFFFDTVCDIQVFCLPSQAEAAYEEVHRIFSEIENLFSPGQNDVSSPFVTELFKISRRVYEDSEGCFDISVGSLSALWGFTNKSFRLPAPDEVADSLRSVGLEKVQIKKDSLILLPGMKLDWGGVAKGLAVDLASRSLQKMGLPCGFINAGGDLFCWGPNPQGEPWKIGIKHPRQKDYLGVLYLSSVAVATSGDYQRYFEREGVRYHHLLDPKTGYPARGKQSVTVVGPETVFCDAISTALFVSPKPEDILRKYVDYGAIIVASDGEIKMLGRPFPFEKTVAD